MSTQQATYLLRTYGMPGPKIPHTTQRLVDDLDALPSMLITYAISHKTADYGDKYVVRRHGAGDGEVVTENKVALFDDLAAARASLPCGLIRFGPAAGEDPVIVESWL